MRDTYHKLLAAVLMTASSTFLYGQSNTITGSATQVDINQNPYGQVQVIKPKPPSVQGSFYYHNRWNLGNVYLFNNQEVKDILIRYNLRTQQIEMKTRLDDPNVKVVDAKHVKNFFLQDYKNMSITHFRNKVNYSFEEEGFFEVVEDGKVQLLGHKNVMYVQSYYVQAIDVGDRNDRILKINKIFLYVDGEIVPVPKAYRKWKKIFAKHDIDISEVLEKYDIDTSLLSGQKRLVSYINIMMNNG